jgi:predicted nucleic acid-binding Zn ribbon protein
MSDEIKQIAALIGHHQALEKRVTSLTEEFHAASSQLQQQSETLSKGLYAGTPENSVTKAKDHMICMTLNKLRVM